MILSLVNLSSLDANEVRAAVRAVNRQIREDFKAYWGREAFLRIDSPPSEDTELRADAVIYIEDSCGDSDYLGYHEIDGGIPFGVVFLDICEELEEPWTVTLSHEALELIVDPEVNLFSRGPHPADPGREVLHWYEVCDAVQTEVYEIDRVPVSNFLLPLYFTGEEETGRRNDYLGTEGSLPSFGVRPGGYVGFFDPLIGDHDQFFADDHARRRMEIKVRATKSRRALRYQKGPSLDRIAAGGGPDFADLILDAYTVELSHKNLNTARRVLRETLGTEGWTIEPVKGSSKEYDIVSESNEPTAMREAWELLYRLRDHPEVVYAEPHFLSGEPPRPGGGDALRASVGGTTKEAPANREWSLKQLKVEEAWKLPPPAGGKQKGEGVKIAHPDSGYRPHREINDILLPNEDADFWSDDDEPLDPQGDHGLGTASVIASRDNNPPDEASVTGTAPAARVLSLRVTKPRFLRPAPVLFWKGNRKLRDAIHHVVAKNDYPVISMSLGGPFKSKSLHNAIREAVKQGIIPVAATGQTFTRWIRPVFYPARYNEVIAVTATGPDARTPSWAGRGKQVDVAAPGASVYRAMITDDGSEDVAPGDGTSFSCAAVAGIAALWIAFHTKKRLEKAFTKEGIALAFKRLLRETARQPETGWDPLRYGAGIVDCEALLAKGLEMELPARTLRDFTSSAPGEDEGGVEAFFEMFDDAPRDGVRAALKETLNVDDDELDATLADVGDELLFQFAINPSMQGRFTGSARQMASGETRTRSRPRGMAESVLSGSLDSSVMSHRLRQRLLGPSPSPRD